MADKSALTSLPHSLAARPLSKQAIRLLLYGQLLVLDILAVAAGCAAIGRIGGHEWLSPSGTNLAFLVIPAYVFFALNQHAYSLRALDRPEESLRRSLMALATTAFFVLAASYFMSSRPLAPHGALTAGFAVAALLLLLARLTFHRLVVRHYAGRLVHELVIVDDASYRPSPDAHILDARAGGIQPDLQSPAMINRLAACLRGVDRVVVACPTERQQSWSLLLKGSNIRGEILVPQDETIGAIGLARFGEAETLVVSRGPLSLRSRAQKRALDLLFTVPLLIALTPLLAGIALLIKMESRGPVFFRQNRIGRSNSVFSILKFRSMRTEACDAAGNRSASRNDDRITRVGAFIRSTSIDELPQLINVLRGDMSLVGPRPHALGSLAGDKLFWEVDEQYWVRHALKPGITGLAQIRGYRGATLRREDLENRLRADLEYVNGWSLWLDLRILFATAKVIKHQNAF